MKCMLPTSINPQYPFSSCCCCCCRASSRRFIVEQYGLRFLLNEVPHDERIHPVALPAFPSTAPTGQVRCRVPCSHNTQARLRCCCSLRSVSTAVAWVVHAASIQGHRAGSCVVLRAAWRLLCCLLRFSTPCCGVWHVIVCLWLPQCHTMHCLV